MSDKNLTFTVSDFKKILMVIIPVLIVASTGYIYTSINKNSEKTKELENKFNSLERQVIENKEASSHINTLNTSFARLNQSVEALVDKTEGNKETLDMLLRLMIESKRAENELIKNDNSFSVKIAKRKDVIF